MFKSFTENAAKQNWKFGVSWVMQKLTVRVSASMTVRVSASMTVRVTGNIFWQVGFVQN
jgi:hypothetical protein